VRAAEVKRKETKLGLSAMFEEEHGGIRSTTYMVANDKIRVPPRMNIFGFLVIRHGFTSESPTDRRVFHFVEVQLPRVKSSRAFKEDATASPEVII
jgi:hypothetical protein